MTSRLKTELLANPLFHRAWAELRRRQLHRDYLNRRESFAALAAERKLVYSEDGVVDEVRGRIAKRGYVPAPRKMGEIHTFACIPQFSWHRQLLPDLLELGPVTLFDYVAYGYSHDEFATTGWRGIERRREMTSLILPAFRKAHERHPVDWVLCYGGGQDTSAAVIRRITEEFGVPTADMTFDDKQGWVGPNVGEHRTGAADITAEFDLFATSARVACDWHMLSGGRAIYMPEGVDVSRFHPMQVERDIDVSFVGVAYGFRPWVVRDLRRFGIPVRTFGSGWEGSEWADNLVEIFNRSKVNLGMGGIGYSETLTNVKGRDFEIPPCGGGVYLTSFSADLAQHFVVGEEILCYQSREEMVELIRYYLARPDAARAIAERARARCLKEHRWLHRYQKMLRILGVLDDPRSRE